jgi:hypothetical protein
VVGIVIPSAEERIEKEGKRYG